MELTTGDLLYFTNCSSGYTQSDEISLFFPPVQDKVDKSHSFFNLRISKLISLTASYTSVRFIYHLSKEIDDPELIPLFWSSHFDARAYNLDNEDLMTENALWRYEDVYKNSVNNMGYKYMKSKEMLGKRPEIGRASCRERV